ncbi:MAG: transcriptional regulator [Bacteroidales bacterium]|jgi:predicted transcriptional regulator|nr:transcriptional regulator [Bacteroidales bacterium]
MAKKIHIGKLIKAKVSEKNLSKVKFAKLINYERTNVYHIFERPTIDIDLLIKISVALNYDFIKEVYLKDSTNDSNIVLIDDVIEKLNKLKDNL